VDPGSNVWANLSYYLNCVLLCLPDAEIPRRLTWWKSERFDNDVEAQREIIRLCNAYSPQKLTGRAFHRVHPEYYIADGTANTFYKITEAAHLVGIAVNAREGIFIDAKQVRVVSIMVYKDTWLAKYFSGPYRRAAGQLRRTEERIAAEKHRQEQELLGRPHIAGAVARINERRALHLREDYFDGKVIVHDKTNYFVLSEITYKDGPRRWLPDTKFTDCPSCKTPFSFTLRRHHCRLCGMVGCYTCCPSIGLSKPHFCKELAWVARIEGSISRVCHECVDACAGYVAFHKK